MIFYPLGSLLTESVMGNEYVNIRRLNPISFDRQRCLFVRLRAGGRRYNYFFTISRHQSDEYYMKIHFNYDFYTYKRGSMLSKAIADTPRRAAVNAIEQAWQLASEFVSQPEKWTEYFYKNASLKDIPQEVIIDRILIHHDKQFSDNRLEWRWLQQTIKRIYPSATVSNKFQASRMSRDIEAKLSEPLVIRPKTS